MTTGFVGAQTAPITSSGLNTQINLSATPPAGKVQYDITGGTRPGGGPNLFHSFGNFGVPNNNIANFLNDSGLTTSNILGRVTEGNISNVYGTIQTTGFGNANLFLMNPAGFLLGPNATLNVGGSVSFTTAQYMRLQDALFGSANFYANPANDSMANSILAIDASAFEFISASPAAYGFLTAPDPNATITVQGSALSTPSAPDGSPPNSVSLVGGKVVIEGGTQLSASKGKIQLATSASPGEFDVNFLASLPNVDGASFSSFGTINIAPGSSIDVHGTSTVFIKGGQLVLSVNDATLNTSDSSAQANTISLSQGSSIVTSNSGADPGAEVQITVGTLNLDGSTITTETFSDGNGGNVTANVGRLSLTNFAAINSNNFSFGLGQGGDVTVQGQGGSGSANSVTLSNFSGISTLTFGPERGGNVNLNSGTVTLESSSSIQTGTFGGGGVGGDVVVSSGTVGLTDGAYIQTATQNFNPGGGQGGNLIIQGPQGKDSAAETVILSSGSRISTITSGSSDGGQLDITSKSLMLDGAFTTINSAVNDVGRGGDLVLSVQQASLSGEATIIAQTNSADLNAQPGPTLTVQGLQGTGSMADSVVLSGFGSGIISDSFGTGRAGDVAVHAKTISLTDEAVIQAGTSFTTAAGGNVTIDAVSVDISGGGHISSQASHSDAGQIVIRANTLNVDNGSIATNSLSEGRAGDVVVNVGSLNLSQGGNINTSTNGSGRAGDITIRAGTLTLSGGSKISSASIGTELTFNLNTGAFEPPGPAGNITIAATSGLTSNASTIATSADANHGGDISITAQNVQLSNGTLINANSDAPLQVTKLVPDGNGNMVEQVVGDGNAGNITINSASSFIMQESSLTTAAAHASGGQITVNAPDIFQLTNSNIVTSVQGSSGDTAGGDISIDPQFVILQNSQIFAQANAGTGGNISIVSNVFLADPYSLVDATSQLGVSGVIDIRSPVSNISGVVGRLPESVLAAQALLRAACAARLAESKVSSFVERGRDHIPVGPEGLLATPYVPPPSEPSQVSSTPVTSTGASETQIRRFIGQELTPRVHVLSGDAACQS